MAYFPETAQFDSVRILERTDPVDAGINGDGIMNTPPRNLTNRTAWLKAACTAVNLSPNSTLASFFGQVSSLSSGLTFGGALNMGGYKITNLGTPVNGDDAINKSWAESNLGIRTYVVTKPILSGSASPDALASYNYTAKGSVTSAAGADGVINYVFMISGGMVTVNASVATITFPLSTVGTTQKIFVFGVDSLGNQSAISMVEVRVMPSLAPSGILIHAPGTVNRNTGVTTPLSVTVDTLNDTSVTYFWQYSWDNSITWSTARFNDNKIYNPTYTWYTGDNTGNNVFRCTVSNSKASATPVTVTLGSTIQSCTDYYDDNINRNLPVDSYVAAWTAVTKQLSVTTSGSPFAVSSKVSIDGVYDVVAAISGSNPQLVTLTTTTGSNGTAATLQKIDSLYDLPQQTNGASANWTTATITANFVNTTSDALPVTKLSSNQFEFVSTAKVKYPFRNSDQITVFGSTNQINTINGVPFTEVITERKLQSEIALVIDPDYATVAADTKLCITYTTTGYAMGVFAARYPTNNSTNLVSEVNTIRVYPFHLNTVTGLLTLGKPESFNHLWYTQRANSFDLAPVTGQNSFVLAASSYESLYLINYAVTGTTTPTLSYRCFNYVSYGYGTYPVVSVQELSSGRYLLTTAMTPYNWVVNNPATLKAYVVALDYSGQTVTLRSSCEVKSSLTTYTHHAAPTSANTFILSYISGGQLYSRCAYTDVSTEAFTLGTEYPISGATSIDHVHSLVYNSTQAIISYTSETNAYGKVVALIYDKDNRTMSFGNPVVFENSICRHPRLVPSKATEISLFYGVNAGAYCVTATTDLANKAISLDTQKQYRSSKGLYLGAVRVKDNVNPELTIAVGQYMVAGVPALILDVFSNVQSKYRTVVTTTNALPTTITHANVINHYMEADFNSGSKVLESVTESYSLPDSTTLKMTGTYAGTAGNKMDVTIYAVNTDGITKVLRDVHAVMTDA